MTRIPISEGASVELRRNAASGGGSCRWAKRVETSGSVAPSKMGGDRRSQRIEAHSDFIRAQIKEQPDLMMWTASPQRHHSAKAWSQERHKEGDRP